MSPRFLLAFLFLLSLHAQSRQPTHRAAASAETADGAAADAAIRKLGDAADSGFAELRGDYHGPGNRWESKYKIPGALFCNVDWRKQQDDSVGEFYCDMGEHYSYQSAADAMRQFAEPIRKTFPTWREIVKSDGNHPDFSDSDLRLFPAPHLKGERSPSIMLERIKSGEEYMVVFFFDSVMSPEELVGKYGGPPARAVRSVDYDYGRLVNDLIRAQSRTWMMNRFTADSAIVTSTGTNANGVVIRIDAHYNFIGMNGPALGSVILTLPDGQPQCLYFFDFPQVCKPVDQDIVYAFGNNQYLKK